MLKADITNWWHTVNSTATCNTCTIKLLPYCINCTCLGMGNQLVLFLMMGSQQACPKLTTFKTRAAAGGLAFLEYGGGVIDIVGNGRASKS